MTEALIGGCVREGTPPAQVDRCYDAVMKREEKLFGSGRLRSHSLIGKGTWGEVHKATMDDFVDVVIKISKMSPEDDTYDKQAVLREVFALRHLHGTQNDHVVPFYGAFAGEGFASLVMSRAWMDLNDWMEPEYHARSSKAQRQNLSAQLCAAVGYMHKRHLVHRDLKPGNILLYRSPTGRLDLRLCDFGATISIEQGVHSRLELATTWMYRAPEIAELRALVPVAAKLLGVHGGIDTGYLMSWKLQGQAGRARLKERMEGCGLRILDAGFSGDQYRVCGAGLLRGKMIVADVAMNEDDGCLDFLIAAKKSKLCRRGLRKALQSSGAQVFSRPKDYPDELLKVVCGYDGFFRPPQDLYSLGHIVQEILTGHHVMEQYESEDTDADLSDAWRDLQRTRAKKQPLCPLLRVFQGMALERDPLKRMTADDAFRLLAAPS